MTTCEPLPEFPTPFLSSDEVSEAEFTLESTQLIPGPRIVLERKLDSFTSAIREKPLWWEKVFKTAIVQHWQSEAVQQEVGIQMFNFAIQVYFLDLLNACFSSSTFS